MTKNADPKTIDGFGEEWSAFDQTELSGQELDTIFEHYFGIFPWDRIGKEAVGFDLGCGSGRWAKRVAPKVGKLFCIDPSPKALDVAKGNLASAGNCEFICASVDEMPLKNDSMDFGYSLGVLHHIPDTPKALRSCVEKLKLGAPFLVYLYYALDNRPLWFRSIWRATHCARMGISRLPFGLRLPVTQLIAASVYWPLARLSRAVEILGGNPASIPLSYYRSKSFYTMRTDALDRFGTRLEQRFSKEQIEKMMTDAGLTEIRFSPNQPYWVACGIKKGATS